jgi:NADP-dependent 3-hydroxy acid dehydrogenase YdfG
MTNYIEGKVIIITGAGSTNGFGKWTAVMAAQNGAKVVCADINEEGLRQTVDQIKSAGGVASYVVTDVASRNEMFAMAKYAKSSYGRIDVLVNNAGIMPLAYFSDHEKAWKAWDKAIDVNIRGVLYGIQAVFDTMIEQKRGHIVNISSVAMNFPLMGSGVYQASKVAVQYITESLRKETRGIIKATVVRPSGVGATDLKSTIINQEGSAGMFAQNWPIFKERAQKRMSGQAPAEVMDRENIQYWSLDPVSLAEKILYVINQPWGIEINDITVHASNDLLIT